MTAVSTNLPMTLRILTAGESHGPALVAILEGMIAGLPVDLEFINSELNRRRKGTGSGPRMKLEQDEAILLSGVLSGVTTGAPIAIQINNLDHSRWKSKDIPPMTTPRPGHADLTGTAKYGYPDLRFALERASARETATRVAIGAICKLLLASFDIQIIGYVASIGPIHGHFSNLALADRARLAELSPVRCPDEIASTEMQALIEAAIREKNTLGGIIEIIALGVPVGLGSHVQADRRLTGRLASAILGTQAIKGVEFGEAFQLTEKRGTEAHDAIRLDGNKIVRPTNRAGGLEGGMTNGEPLVIRAAMKPIATILTPQPTVDLKSGTEVGTEYERSDFCPVPRAVPILESVVAIVLADALLEKLGGDSLTEVTKRFADLPKGYLDDFNLDGQAHILWP